MVSKVQVSSNLVTNGLNRPSHQYVSKNFSLKQAVCDINTTDLVALIQCNLVFETTETHA